MIKDKLIIKKLRKIIKLFKKEDLEFYCCECCNGLGIKYKGKYITYSTICELEDLEKELEEYIEGDKK